MKEIIINDNHLLDSDIEKEVVRVKGLIINSHGKILLAHNNNTFQFPGGHLDEGEDMNECITREIVEETGIHVILKEEPFLCIKTYDNDYFGTGKKVLNSIYYYRFFTDELPNFEETHYDELELATEFDLFYIPFVDLKNFLQKCIEDEKIDPNIGREMIHVVEIYNEIYNTK
ncbi:MAG: NUDIX hydrolase [Bacilli bacterium]|nr:NUDIX hydrolase [Bacilli bacterium]